MHVVFGASGFIGSHLVEALVARGEPVAACVRPTSQQKWLEGLPVERRTCDLASGEGLDDAVRGATVIYNLSGATRSCTPEQLWQVNRVGGEHLAQAARRVPELRRFVQVTSAIAAGPSHERPVTEEDESHPIDPYGESKLALEELIRTMDDLPWVILRPSAVYGPRDLSLLPVFELANHGIFFSIGDGKRKLSLVHVRDVVRACLIAGTHPAAHHELFYVTGDIANWHQLAEVAGQAIGRKLQRVRMPTGVLRVAGELMEWRFRVTGKKHSLNHRKVEELVADGWTCSGEKAARVLGFEPETHLVEGFTETVRWWQDEGWLPVRHPEDEEDPSK